MRFCLGLFTLANIRTCSETIPGRYLPLSAGPTYTVPAVDLLISLGLTLAKIIIGHIMTAGDRDRARERQHKEAGRHTHQDDDEIKYLRKKSTGYRFV